MAKQLKAIKCPSDELAATNCAIVNTKEFDQVKYVYFNLDFFLNFKYLNKIFRHIEIIGQSNNFVFTVRKDNQVPLGEIGFGAVQVNKTEFIYKNKYIIF